MEGGLCECGAGVHLQKVFGATSYIPRRKRSEVSFHDSHTMPSHCNTFPTQGLLLIFSNKRQRDFRGHLATPHVLGGCHLAGVRQEVLRGCSPSGRAPCNEGRLTDLQDLVTNGQGRWRSERHDAKPGDLEKWPPAC